MRDSFEALHIVPVIFYIISLVILILSINNSIVLLTLLIGLIEIFILCNRAKSLKNSIKFFVPLAIITAMINMIFSQMGSTILFFIGNKAFTLETLIYALIMSFKILLILLSFQIFDFIVDSDQAISFFSKIMPKATLTILIALKLLPNMRHRITELKNVYRVRGINYDVKGIKENIVNSVPLLSILLEDSLEGSFDIAESAYVRGFLSNKRSIYEKTPFKLIDIFFIINIITVLIYFFMSYKSITMDSIVLTYKLESLVNLKTLIFLMLVALEFVIIFIMLRCKSKRV